MQAFLINRAMWGQLRDTLGDHAHLAVISLYQQVVDILHLPKFNFRRGEFNGSSEFHTHGFIKNDALKPFDRRF